MIYQLENIKAKQEGRESRLKPFDLHVNWSIWGPSLAESHTCKTQSIALLANVLSEEQINRLTDGGKHPTIPRYSGVTESIYLHSTGPLRQHVKRSGEVVNYRDFKDPGVKLYWTIPPQEAEVLTEDTKKLLEIDREYCQEVKIVARRLQRLEWLLRNAVVPKELEAYKNNLIHYVIECYQAFSIIEPKEETTKVSSLTGYAYYLFSLPRDKEEQNLQNKILRAKQLFHCLYFAIIDDWQVIISKGTSLEGISPDDYDIEALTSYLSIKDKKELCKIIGRTYYESEPVLADMDQPLAADSIEKTLTLKLRRS